MGGSLSKKRVLYLGHVKSEPFDNDIVILGKRLKRFYFFRTYVVAGDPNFLDLRVFFEDIRDGETVPQDLDAGDDSVDNKKLYGDYIPLNNFFDLISQGGGGG